MQATDTTGGSFERRSRPHPLPVAESAVPTTSESNSRRSERTRSSILAAAQELFATKGFAATRLDDVAEAVEMSKAALFYYFRDKQSLFDAVLADAFGPLADKLQALLAAEQISVSERIEQSVEAWVDTILTSPSMARLILRLVADGTEVLSQGILSDNNQIAMKFWALFEEGCRLGELKPIEADPFYSASSIIGTSVFYVAALSTLVPPGEFQPLDPSHAATHKKQAVDATRHLLGITPSAGRKRPADPP